MALAVDFCCEETELIMIPVTGGKQNPPQNSTIHKSPTNAGKESMNGIGIAQQIAMILTMHYIY